LYLRGLLLRGGRVKRGWRGMVREREGERKRREKVRG